jgi:hypothetical protein
MVLKGGRVKTKYLLVQEDEVYGIIGAGFSARIEIVEYLFKRMDLHEARMVAGFIERIIGDKEEFHRRMQEHQQEQQAE